MTDEALVSRAQGGDELAMRRLLQRYEPWMRTLTSLYFMRGAEAADLLQEARLGACKAVRDYDSSQRVVFRAFLFLCVRRQVITAVKTARRLKHESLNEAVSLNQPVIGGDDWEDPPLGEVLPDRRQPEPHEVLERREEMDALVAGFDAMSPLQRVAMAGIAAGETYDEIGARTGLQRKQIDNAAQRGRGKIRRALEAAA